MKWFGESWGAPVCEPREEVATPLGVVCHWCDEPIVMGDVGFVLPVAGLHGGTIAEHRECFLRQIFGSAGHQQRTCSCHGGEVGDPPGMTRREAAKAAIAVWEHSGSRKSSYWASRSASPSGCTMVDTWRGYNFKAGDYPTWDGNTPSEQAMLEEMGFPRDFHPTEYEASLIVTAYMES